MNNRYRKNTRQNKTNDKIQCVDSKEEMKIEHKTGKIGTIKKYVNRIINSELFIVLLGIILFAKMALFYELTIYKHEAMSTDILGKTFIYSMVVMSFLLIFKNKLRFYIGTLTNLVFSVVMFADNAYYNYSSGFISISQFSNLQYGEQIKNTLGDLVEFNQIFYFIDIIFVAILLITKFIKIEKIKERRYKPALVYAATMLIVFGSTVKVYVTEADECSYNKKTQVELGTLYSLHYLDLQNNFNSKTTAKYSSKDIAMTKYDELKNKYNSIYDSDCYGLQGIASGKNVIMLQMESYQSFLLNKEINGKEITPNFNKFFAENVKIDNMMIQSYSTTADSEHSAMNSLYPLDNGVCFSQYSSNTYDDIFKMYKNANYYTMYVNGNESGFWNRKAVYKSLGVDDIVFKNDFDEDSELINDWLSDETLYRQTVKKLKDVTENCESPVFMSLLSESCHTAFDLPGLENKYDKVSIDVGEYKDTYFGNYLEAANYADYAFGVFIDELKAEGLYDDTLIFIFGDHYAMQMYNDEMIDYIEKTDHLLSNIEAEINYVNVVCGAHIPGVESMEISKIVSKLDIKPTLTYLSGIDDGISLGSNIFGNKDFACLNNGIIVTDEYYYNGIWYDRASGDMIDTDNISDELKQKLNFYKESMEEELTLSNSIVLGNLLK